MSDLDAMELRAILSQALDAVKVSAPSDKPEHVEPPGKGTAVGNKACLEGESVFWWHVLPNPTAHEPRDTPLGVLTLGGDGRGCVYMSQSWVRGLDYWPDITALTPDQARRLGHALLAAANHADQRSDEFSVVTDFRRKAQR